MTVADRGTRFLGASSASDAAAAPTVPVNRAVVLALLGLWMAAIVAASFWEFTNLYADFFLFGAAACVVVTMPMLNRDYDLASPWTMLTLMVYIGCGLRGAFISALGPENSQVDFLYLLGQESSYFAFPSFVYLFALALIALAYSARPASRGHRPAWLSGYQFGPQVNLVVVACASVGLVALYFYIENTGGLTEALSAKRTTIPGLDLSGYGGGFGSLRAVNKLSSFAFWLFIASQAVNRGNSLTVGRIAVLSLLFFNAAALPIYASTRGEVAYILIIGLVIHVCLSRRSVKLGAIALVGVLMLLLLTALTFLRYSPSSDDPTLNSATAVESFANTLVLNRNFGDMTVTAHVINNVPERLGYTYGSSVLVYLAAPIPRSVWPDKPLISAGPTIGVKVYENERSGVPPGGVGEMYWAFGMTGVVLGSVLFGRFLRTSYARIRLSNPGVVVLYATTLFIFGINAMAVSFGHAFFDLVVTGVFGLVVLTLAGRADDTPTAGTN